MKLLITLIALIALNKPQYLNAQKIRLFWLGHFLGQLEIRLIRLIWLQPEAANV